MKIIAIRGLPGSGKGTVAKILSRQISGAKIICVDEYKKAFQVAGGHFIDSLKYSYQKTLEVLTQLYKDDEGMVIIEELFNDAEFVKVVQDFGTKNGVAVYWFCLKRPIEQLLDVENKRKRKIKNSREDLEKLEREINEIRIDDEVSINNDSSEANLENEVEPIVDLLGKSDELTQELKLK